MRKKVLIPYGSRIKNWRNNAHPLIVIMLATVNGNARPGDVVADQGAESFQQRKQTKVLGFRSDGA